MHPLLSDVYLSSLERMVEGKLSNEEKKGVMEEFNYVVKEAILQLNIKIIPPVRSLSFSLSFFLSLYLISLSLSLSLLALVLSLTHTLSLFYTHTLYLTQYILSLLGTNL